MLDRNGIPVLWIRRDCQGLATSEHEDAAVVQ
jgi:hypothetical protein